MKAITTLRLRGTVDIHSDGDIFVCNPKTKKCHYAGSIVDKDLDDAGIIVSVGGKFVRDFIKVFKTISK